MKFTRREILTTFLGAPFALQACSVVKNSPSPQGEIVGANVELGHLLRGGAAKNFQVSPDKREKVGVLIVGGGASGLSAARRLKQRGFEDFQLLELEANIGGTAQNGVSNVSKYPWGAHYLPVPSARNVDLIELLREMNLVESLGANGEPIIYEQFLCRDPEERIFFKGRWYEGLYPQAGASNEDKSQFERFQNEINFWIAWRDGEGRRAFTLPVAACSEDAFALELDKITFAEWLQTKNFTSERLFWLCDYACRDDYGLKLDQTSAWAGLFYFCSRTEKIGAESSQFITFPEGNGKFINHLQQFIGVDKLRRNSAVIEIVPNENECEVVYFDAAAREMRALTAQKVIYAAPLFTSRYVIRDFRENAPVRVEEFQHNAWLVANLHVSARPQNRFGRDFPLCWDNVLYESPSLGYVNAMHQSGKDYGASVLTYYFPMCSFGANEGRTKLFAMNFAECADVVLSDLERAHNEIRQITERIEIMRWGHAMISPRPNFLWNGIRKTAAKPFRNIHFAHSDLSGFALFEEAFYQGTRAAEEILQSSVKRL